MNGTAGTFVKRIIGIPGDIVRAKSGTLYVNGLPAPTEAIGYAGDFLPITVPRDHYFLVGDNIRESCDSRAFGPVPRQALVGTLVFRVAPWRRVGMI